MNGKRAVLLIFGIVCMLILAQASLANHNYNYGSYYGDSSYDRSYGGNAFRGFNINFDTYESTGNGYSTTTYTGFREGDSSFDRSFGNNHQGSGNSVDHSYFDQYSDTIDHEYSYNNKDSRTWGNYYGGSNNYYMNDYHTTYPGYGNYGSEYGPYYGSGYGGNYRAYGNAYSDKSLGYYNGGRVYA